MPVSAEVATLFLDEMARRNILVTLDDAGNYTLALHGLSSKIGLENLSRDFERDRDPDHVVRFVDAITSLLELPDWQEAEGRIRWQPEPADHQFGDTLREVVSDKVALVLVHVDPSESQIRWLSPADAEQWNKSGDELKAVAGTNMARILRQTTIEAMAIEEHQLGILNNEHVAFKAALLFCPELRELVEPVLGWPLFAVMPCRDFVYVLSQKDEPLLGRMGQVVVREYEQGGYPITTEVFEITDEGIQAIGDYRPAPRPDSAPGPDEDGMKTIRYRGGIAAFRISAHWAEQENDDGGIYYDPDDETGTLRLSILTVASETPVTTRTAMEVLEERCEESQGTLTDLGHGNALLRYTEEAEEEGESLTMHYWQIANVVPPSHFRMAFFSYTVPTELAEDDDVADELATLEKELRACQFARELSH